MIDAIQNRIPNKNNYHNPNIKDNNNTVAHYLKYNNLPIPNAWYDDDMKNTPKNPEFV